jgi:hypothetical protein
MFDILQEFLLIAKLYMAYTLRNRWRSVVRDMAAALIFHQVLVFPKALNTSLVDGRRWAKENQRLVE